MDGAKVKAVTDFLFLGSKITVDDDCCHKIRWLLLSRKAITNLHSVLKSRDITIPTKVCIVKAMVFPVLMNSCESWMIKAVKCQRIYTFKLWCWRRLLKVPWTRRGSNQSILREIHREYSLEGLMLKLQYFGCLMRTDSLEKYLMLGKIRGRRRRGCWRMRWLDGITDAMNWCWANSRRWWGTGKPSVLKPMEWWRVGHDLAAEQQWQQQAEGRKVGRSPLACPLSWKQLGVSCGLSADCGQGCL